MTLRELNIGDRFITETEYGSKTPTRYKVIGKPEFNLQAGTATRVCLNEKIRELQNKQCRLKVMKLPLQPTNTTLSDSSK